MGWTTFDSSGKQQIAGAVADMPVGTVQPYAGANAPSGWLLCDGSSLSTTAFPELFAAIGYTYGGSGSSFSVPDLRGRVVAGRDNMGGSAASRLTATVLSASNTLGATGGAQTHTMSTTEMPSHNHGGATGTGTTGTGTTGNDSPDHTHTGPGGFVSGGSLNQRGNSGNSTGEATSGASTRHTHSIPGLSVPALSISSQGGGGAHNNTQPTIVLNYIIFATSLDKRIKVNTPPQYATTLPGAPIDGQEVYYIADSTNGVIWHLRYNAASSSSYKWEFIGGASLKSKVGTSGVIGTTNLSTYTAPATRPSITVPLNGDYEVRAQADAVPTVVSANTFCNLAIFADSTVKSVSRLSYGNGYYPSITTQLPLIDVVTGVAGTRVIDVRYSTSATTSTWEFGLLNNQILHVTPVRVG